MKKRYIIITIILIAAFQNVCDAQHKTAWKKHRSSFIFGAGANNFLGDLGGANQNGTNGIKDFNMPAIRPCFEIGYLYQTTKNIALKTDLIYATLAGNDKYTSSPFRNDRNCNFRSPLIELSEQFEYSLFSAIKTGKQHRLAGVRGMGNLGLSSYLFVGISAFYFDPQGQYIDGKWYALKPLCTEGEGLVPGVKKYSLFQIGIPFGIGFKFVINKDWTIGIEYGIRKTFTDYIDDVSTNYVNDTIFNVFHGKKQQLAIYFANPSNHSLPNWAEVTAPGNERGDPAHKDSYMLAFISFYYTIHKHSFTFPKYR